MSVKYIAKIKNVREVCLVGSAELEFWKAHLSPLRLVPAELAGQARVLVSVVKLKWMGIAFEELSIAVPIEPPDASMPSIYLVSAFSTSRLLAWCERMFFHTPYEHAQIAMHAEQPWSLKLRDSVRSTLATQSQQTATTTSVNDDWTGSIFLPPARPGSRRKFFYAKLSGPVQVAPFVATNAEFKIQPSDKQRAIQLLIDSHFAPIEWRVRPNAVHARSKTFTEGGR